MEINKIHKCKLHDDDYIINISVIYTKEDLEKLNLKTEEKIDNYIKNKLLIIKNNT